MEIGDPLADKVVCHARPVSRFLTGASQFPRLTAQSLGHLVYAGFSVSGRIDELRQVPAQHLTFMPQPTIPLEENDHHP